MLSSITLNIDRSSYQPGDSISGSIIVNLHAPCKLLTNLNELTISVVGTERTRWNQEAEFAYLAYGDEIPYFPGSPLTGEMVVLDEKITVKDYNSSENLIEGKHEFSFTHRLPFNLPASTEWKECASEGTITYNIKACLRPITKRDPNSQKPSPNKTLIRSQRSEKEMDYEEGSITASCTFVVLNRTLADSLAASSTMIDSKTCIDRENGNMFCFFPRQKGGCRNIKFKGEGWQSAAQGETVAFVLNLTGDMERELSRYIFQLVQKTSLKDNNGLRIEYEKPLHSIRLSDASVKRVCGGKALQIDIKLAEDWSVSSRGNLVIHEYRALVEEVGPWYKFWRSSGRSEIELIVTPRYREALEDEEDLLERCATGDSDITLEKHGNTSKNRKRFSSELIMESAKLCHGKRDNYEALDDVEENCGREQGFESTKGDLRSIKRIRGQYDGRGSAPEKMDEQVSEY